MYDSLINLLCDGDFHARDLARKFFTLEDMELLATEKAAATNSDQFREFQ